MHAYRRHQLVWLTEVGWCDLLEGAVDSPSRWDAQARDCLNHWANARLPLVVTRQPRGLIVSKPVQFPGLALGLAAPLRWDRRRLSFSVPLAAVQRVAEFPSAADITGQLPRDLQAGWRVLCAGFTGCGVSVRVCGSHGWQRLSGWPCVHEQSDIDLVIAVATPEAADALAALLQRAPFDRPRIDGEFLFADGAAVAWREWAPWRSGKVAQVLVKRLNGASLEDMGSWCVAGPFQVAS